ncbi:MAG: dihydrofolate reductase [Deltaproteobacteria bacterium]
MIISCIVAIGKNNVIGLNNKMPWHIPEDLKHFKKTTTGHCVILGRKNFDSIGRPLPQRTNIIITRNKSFFHSGCKTAESIEKALSIALESGENEAFIIGGAEIYKQTIEYWNKLYLTEIDAFFEGDTFFPELDLSQWIMEKEKTVLKSDSNPYNLTFRIYRRKRND